jgi:hypothetical protein
MTFYALKILVAVIVPFALLLLSFLTKLVVKGGRRAGDMYLGLEAAVAGVTISLTKGLEILQRATLGEKKFDECVVGLWLAGLGNLLGIFVLVWLMVQHRQIEEMVDKNGNAMIAHPDPEFRRLGKQSNWLGLGYLVVVLLLINTV